MTELELLAVELGILQRVEDGQLSGTEDIVVTAALTALAVFVHTRVPADVTAAIRAAVDAAAVGPVDQPPAVLDRLRSLWPAASVGSGWPSYLLEPDRLAAPAAANPPVVIAGDPGADSLWTHRPDSWEPDEWRALLDGGAGAPWAMARDGERVISICHTPVRHADGAEAGTWTDPAYRGRGLAAATVVAWARQLSPGPPLFYSTNVDNRSSQRVAERLGLRRLGTTWKLAPPRGD